MFAKELDLAAAEAVAGAGLDALQALREHNVLRVVPPQGADRYRLYGGIRELSAGLRTSQARVVLRELERIEPEMRAALSRSTHDATRAAALFEGLAVLRQRSGPALELASWGERLRAGLHDVAEADPRRARSLCEEAMPSPGADVRTALFARAQVAVLSTRLADHEAAAREADALIADANASSQELARAWYIKAIVLADRGDDDEEPLRRATGAALDHALRSGDPSLHARTQLVVAMIEAKLGPGGASLGALDRARAACILAGDVVAACIASMTRVSALVETLPPREAIVQLTVAIEEASRLGMVTLQAHGLWQRALLRVVSGHIELAESDLVESSAAFGGSPMASVCTAARAARRDRSRGVGLRFDRRHRRRRAHDARRRSTGFARGGPGPAPHPRGPRVARVLAQKLVEAPRAGCRATLVCGEAEFTVEGTHVSLSGKNRLLRLYRALVDSHRADPERFVSRRELTEAGWSGEKILAQAATNRLSVALSTLRRLGLPLEADAGGIRLPPRIRVDECRLKLRVGGDDLAFAHETDPACLRGSRDTMHGLSGRRRRAARSEEQDASRSRRDDREPPRVPPMSRTKIYLVVLPLAIVVGVLLMLVLRHPAVIAAVPMLRTQVVRVCVTIIASMALGALAHRVLAGRTIPSG